MTPTQTVWKRRSQPTSQMVIQELTWGVTTVAADVRRPNLVFIPADDLGWRDTGPTLPISAQHTMARTSFSPRASISRIAWPARPRLSTPTTDPTTDPTCPIALLIGRYYLAQVIGRYYLAPGRRTLSLPSEWSSLILCLRAWESDDTGFTISECVGQKNKAIS